MRVKTDVVVCLILAYCMPEGLVYIGVGYSHIRPLIYQYIKGFICKHIVLNVLNIVLRVALLLYATKINMFWYNFLTKTKKYHNVALGLLSTLHFVFWSQQFWPKPSVLSVARLFATSRIHWQP